MPKWTASKSSLCRLISSVLMISGTYHSPWYFCTPLTSSQPSFSPSAFISWARELSPCSLPQLPGRAFGSLLSPERIPELVELWEDMGPTNEHLVQECHVWRGGRKAKAWKAGVGYQEGNCSQASSCIGRASTDLLEAQALWNHELTEVIEFN